VTRTRKVLFLICAAVLTVVFVRLGVWQLRRLAERRTRNGLIAARLTLPPADLAALSRDTAEVQYRRVRVDGDYDYDHEFALTNRVIDGAPGVHLVTPLRRAGTDTAVLVDRGWVYAPDGMTIDPARWREPSPVTATGRVQELVRHTEPASHPGHPNEIRWLSPDSIERWAGYPVAPYLVVLERDSTASAAQRIPVRIPVPPLDDGPHLNYAIQWFAFALIAIGGAGVAVFSRRARRVDYDDTRPSGRTA
jgi:surfeit locus 1 family protein